MTNSPIRFRAVAYNLYFGGADRVDEIHAVLAHAAPDAAALTEADDPGVVAELAGRLGMEYAWARGSGDRHIALLSRYPIADWRVYNQKPITQAVLETKLQIPTPNSQSPITLTLYSAHLLPYLLLPFEARRWQALGALLKIIEREAPGPHLILGDLNAIAPGDRVLQHKNPARMQRTMLLQAGLIFRLALPRLLRAGYVDCYRACHPRGKNVGDGEAADGFTWHTGNRTTRYDYVFADRALAPSLRACWVLDDHPAIEAASDHYPVVADFELDSAIIDSQP